VSSNLKYTAESTEWSLNISCRCWDVQ